METFRRRNIGNTEKEMKVRMMGLKGHWKKARAGVRGDKTAGNKGKGPVEWDHGEADVWGW